MNPKSNYIPVLFLFIVLVALVPPAGVCASDFEIDGGAGMSLSRLRSAQGMLIGAWPIGLPDFFELRIETNVELITTRSGKSMVIGGAGPVLRVGTRGKKINPFFDIGGGVSVGSRKKLSEKDFGTIFFFSPTVGAGIKFGRSARGISLFTRFVHHSNAGLFHPNESINSLYVLLGCRF